MCLLMTYSVCSTGLHHRIKVSVNVFNNYLFRICSTGLHHRIRVSVTVFIHDLIRMFYRATPQNQGVC